MKRFLLAALCFISTTVFAVPVFAAEPAGFWQNPVIKTGGEIHPLPQAAFQPEKNPTYKVVFSLTRAGKNPKQINPGIDSVARAVNLFVSAGIPLNHLKFVAVVHGPALMAVLNDVQYHKRFKVDNPNLALVKELTAAGVKFVVCGQQMAGMGIKDDWLDPNIRISLSAMVSIIVLQQQGYVLMPE